MPESEEKRELGGLARSIDALFANAGPASRVADSRGETPSSASGSTEAVHPLLEVAETEAEREPAVVVDPLAQADESAAASPGHPASRESSPDYDVAAAEEPEEVAWGSAATNEAAPATSDLELELPGRVPSDVEPEKAAADQRDLLAEAVEAFLSGSPGAAESVETVAAALRERFVLDPLADAVERLVDASGDPPDQAILDMARSVINPAVASRLVQRMGREQDEGRRAGYLVLCQRLGKIMAVAFRGAMTDSTNPFARRVYHDALIAMGEASRPVIEGMVDDDNRFLVRNAVAILGEIGGDRAVELVTSALANTDARVRREALLSLAKLGDEEASQLVLGSLEDPDPGVRIAAAVAAGELRVERALRPLLNMLDGEQDPDVCLPVLQALGRLEDPGAVQAIEKHAVRTLFSKPQTEVRVAAYRALHHIGTPHASGLLREALDDKDPVVKAAVRELLRGDGPEG